jgi:hypoxanthine-guanine phosphoribosyltransferase
METGLTREDLRQTIQARNPASLQVYTRLDRAVRRMVEFSVTLRGFGLPDRHVVGDGVEDSQRSRSWPCRGMLTPAGLGAHGNRCAPIEWTVIQRSIGGDGGNGAGV